MTGAIRQQGTDSMPEMWTQCWVHHGDFVDGVGIQYLEKYNTRREWLNPYKHRTISFFASANGRSERDPHLTRLFGPDHPDALAAAVRPPPRD